MPKRSLAVLCLVLFIATAFPRAASAGALDYLRWLDRLSGPGEFDGYGFEFAVLCYGKDDLGRTRWQPNYGCYDVKRDTRPRVALGFQIGWLEGDNPLPYAPPRDVDKPEVNAMPIFVTADVGIDRLGFAEAGAGIGWVRFYGEGYSFSRFAIEPRVTLKPLVLVAHDRSERERRNLEWLQVRFSFVGIPGSFEAADFGAIGPFRSESELIGPSMTIAIHALPLIRWIRD